MFPYKFLSPAKINLLLEVLRKREDGYHDIFTVMQPIDLYDKITIKTCEKGRLTLKVFYCDELKKSMDKAKVSKLPSDSKNLALVAAQAFFEKTGVRDGIEIELYKRIPIGAGLGGGSSNAASVLMGLNEIYEEPLNSNDLHAIAAGIGADIPFFLLKGSAVAEGIGDRLKKITLPSFWYVLVWPHLFISTGEIYGEFNLSLTKRKLDININALKNGLYKGNFLVKSLYNDLEKVSIRRFPQILSIKESLKSKGALNSLMSGSGSSVFGIFTDEDTAKEAYADFAEEAALNGWSLYIVKSIGGTLQ